MLFFFSNEFTSPYLTLGRILVIFTAADSYRLSDFLAPRFLWVQAYVRRPDEYTSCGTFIYYRASQLDGPVSGGIPAHLYRITGSMVPRKEVQYCRTGGYNSYGLFIDYFAYSFIPKHQYNHTIRI
jgi:hypothetical protein